MYTVPDRIADGLETIIELPRPDMLYFDQMIVNCSVLNGLTNVYINTLEIIGRCIIEDRRDMIDSIWDTLTKNLKRCVWDHV